MSQSISTVSIFGGTGTPREVLGKYITPTRELGTMLATAGFNVVFCGYSNGLLHEFVNSFKTAKGTLISVYPDDIGCTSARFAQACQTYKVRDVHAQRETMRQLSQIALALPGGLNTFAEILELASHNDALALTARDTIINPIIVCNFDGYYDALEALFQTPTTEGMIKPSQLKQIHFAKTSADVIGHLTVLRMAPRPKAGVLRP